MKAAVIFRLIALTLPLAGRAQTPAEAKAVPDSPGFHLDLMPKPFSRNSTLEMTVFTELTAFGRTQAQATVQAPVYYEAKESGLQSRGFAIAGGSAPSREELDAILQRALAADGYLPASEGHPPGLVLVYFWGSHNRLGGDLAGKFPELAMHYILERAALVGGKGYSHELAQGMQFGFGLADRTEKKIFLFTQAEQDIYYVVVSAYAYDDLARNERRLVWRTTMTVSAGGVSMSESLPPLVATAGNYFGRATTEPIALKRRVRRGTVTLGPLIVIGDSPPAAKPPPADEGPPPK